MRRCHLHPGALYKKGKVPEGHGSPAGCLYCQPFEGSVNTGNMQRYRKVTEGRQGAITVSPMKDQLTPASRHISTVAGITPY